MNRRLHPALEMCLDIGALQVASDFRELTRFSSGKPANTKFIGNMVRSKEHAREGQDEKVINYMVDFILGSEFRPKPDRRTVLCGIPSGGQDYSDRLGEPGALGLEVAHLEKVDNLPGRRTYRPA